MNRESEIGNYYWFICEDGVDIANAQKYVCVCARLESVGRSGWLTLVRDDGTTFKQQSGRLYSTILDALRRRVEHLLMAVTIPEDWRWHLSEREASVRLRYLIAACEEALLSANDTKETP